MADNVPITSGTGTDIATDDVAGVHFQKVKLDLGGDGASSPVSGSVPVSDNGGSLTVDGTFWQATQPVSVASLPALAAGTNNIGDVDVATIAAGDNNIGNVDIVSVPAPLSTTGNGTAASALRVSVASDSTGVLAVTDNGGSLTVDGTFWQATQPVSIASLPALAAGTANIGDVDVLTVPAPLSTTGGGTQATALRVTIASDSTGVLSVDDNGSSLTVDGSVSLAPLASGGLSVFRSLDVDETEEEIKGTAGSIFGWYIANRATSSRSVKFYNATAANVVVGTTTALMTIIIPGNSTDVVAANVMGAHGIDFSTAITIAATTGFVDSDTGAPGASDIIANIFYK